MAPAWHPVGRFPKWLTWTSRTRGILGRSARREHFASTLGPLADPMRRGARSHFRGASRRAATSCQPARTGVAFVVEVSRWPTRGSARRPAGQDLEASSPGRIRNVVLVGPGGSGKTTLVETLLATAGAVSRAGSVADGNTVSDFDPSEQTHGRSHSLAVAPLVHEGTKVNLIDTPGYADFVGELRAGLRAADCALFVIAANEGVDDATRTLWRECAEVGMPRAVVITKLDQARADYDGVLGQAQAAFGDKVMPLYVPVRDGGERDRPRRPPRAVRPRPRGAARRPHRGRDRGVRGRDADGPLPRRRGDRRQGAGRRPRAGRGAGDLLPRRTRLLDDRRRLRRAARPRRPRLPLARRAPLTRGVHAGRRGRARPSPATRRRRWSPRSSRPRATPTSAGSAWSGCSAARCRPTRRSTCPATSRRSSATTPGHPDHDEDERIGALSHAFGKQLSPAAQVVAGDIAAIGRLTRAETGDTLSSVDQPLRPQAVEPARAAAPGRDRGAHQVRRGQALPGARPDRRRGPVAAGREQRRDPPAGAVVHGRGARRRHARAARGALLASTSTPSRCWSRCARPSPARRPARAAT